MESLMKYIANVFLISTLLAATSIHTHAQCPSISSEKQVVILQNLVTRFNLGDPKLFSLKEGDLVGDTCYRRIVLEGGNLQRKITLFMSPDHRFVFGSLADVTVDPVLEAKQEADRIQKLLLSDVSPHKGAQTARIVIVEFGDLQCPYCKQFDVLLKSLPAEQQAKIKVVYKHLPLQKHAWALNAALAGACAAAQSNEQFWVLQDEILKEQQNLTALNFSGEIAKIAARLPNLESGAFLSCLDSKTPESIVKRDVQLAESLSVRGTPTIFINGKRGPKFPSLDELRQWIAEADQNATELAENAKTQPEKKEVNQK